MSADGATITALLPPSSSSERPNRAATDCATARPIGTEPVAETSGTSGEAAKACPTSRPPSTRLLTPAGTSDISAATCSTIAWQASAESGVFSDGFQISESPQTRASMAFQAHTATGKLKAEIMPTGPNGCHCSVSRCNGRSLAIDRP